MSPTRLRARLTYVGAVIALLIAPASAQNGSQFRDWKSSVLGDAAPIAPRTGCAALIALTGYEFSIVSATAVPASGDAPVHCRVAGLIAPEIRFEVALPSAWNGRLYMFGNGGYAGEALDAPARVTTMKRALSRGFATAQTNTGHDGAREPLGTFAADPQKFVDYAFRAVHVTALTARRILQSYYDVAPRHSYFDGCSTGGRQGLISAQRFPDDFDGIVVGAPVLDFSGTMISYAAGQRALAASPIPASKLKTLSEAVYAKCDAADGLKDGLIDDPRRCHFDPAADLPRCAAEADGESCFTAGQLDALAAIYRGVTRNGETFFPGWPVGAEAGWTPWFVSSQAPQPIQVAFGETFFRNMAFGRPNASYDWKTFDVNADLDKVQSARSALDATDPDLSRFKARGGKIVSYYGWADPALNPLMGIRYYESVMQRVGAPTADFYRLFMVPGMFHCGGGVGPSTFDAFTPLVEWVEKGTAPSTIIASRIVDGKVVRTRPLCPYPQVAKYKEAGSIDEAASFTCAAPEHAPSSRP
ncbi:MAG: tannase/feruloyl esterase family alpha/beta hydrolase [Acidobacteria bacterium]|nr:MAG: tannase/feruloyl esterase family alpha/beta hydrolase [Acidobacteriota bacterium]PYQ84081.1 MAG: tannase/feruloyl esterase family alpha/beta hydrolase [Acidobacteriota bacterium]PYR11006.1 MAG: tannase/feruloyl esterase family alpha/beta hydrolase [Acidobacteriota bacterium]